MMDYQLPALGSEEVTTVMAALPVPVIAFLPDGYLAWANEPALELLGIARELLLGTRVADLPLRGRREKGQLVDGARYHVIARSARQARDTVSAHLSSIGQGNAAVNLVILSAVPRTSAEIVALNDVRASCPPGRNRLPPRVDPSSGLLDRATIVRALETEVSRSRRYSNPLSIVVARLNPVQNESVPIAENPAGDESNALISMGQIIQEETRWADRIGRCDAGQLMLVLPETDARSAAVLVAKFKPRVEAALHRQGVHFGHAEWRWGDDSTLLQRRAFAALDEDDVPAHVPRPGIA